MSPNLAKAVWIPGISIMSVLLTPAGVSSSRASDPTHAEPATELYIELLELELAGDSQGVDARIARARDENPMEYCSAVRDFGVHKEVGGDYSEALRLYVAHLEQCDPSPDVLFRVTSVLRREPALCDTICDTVQDLMGNLSDRDILSLFGLEIGRLVLGEICEAREASEEEVSAVAALRGEFTFGDANKMYSYVLEMVKGELAFRAGRHDEAAVHFQDAAGLVCQHPSAIDRLQAASSVESGVPFWCSVRLDLNGIVHQLDRTNVFDSANASMKRCLEQLTSRVRPALE